MNWNLSISFPWPFVFLCILTGIAYAGITYFRSKDAERFSDYRWAQTTLPVFRFLLASTLSFLLLGPVLKYAGFITQKPIIALLIDDSKSMDQKTESAKNLSSNINEVKTQLEQKYDVNLISYSNISQFTTLENIKYSGSETNISQALRYVQDQYTNQNLGGVILLSDGIYNAGSNPSYISENYKTPIYTIGIGDTTIYADLNINNVSHNSLAYLGNEFPFRIEINAKKLKGNQASMQVLLNGKTIEQKTIILSKDKFFEEIDIIAKASKIGQNRIDIRLTTFDNEKNKDNNAYTFYVDVIDSKKKVAIWSKAPHPDLGMLRQTINTNKNYEATISLGSFEVDQSMDLVILHNWFRDNAELTLYEKIKSNGIPVLLIAGDDFNARIFNRGSQDIKFNASGRGTNAALPLINSRFEYFELPSEVIASIRKWPPLRAPFGKWKGYLPSDVSIYQQIGSVTTQEPLVLLNTTNNTRLGIIAGTGLWQWRLAEYEQHESHDNLTSFISKAVQYLAVKEDKKLLKVYPSAKQYGIGENITLLGELYNQSLDPVAGQEININLQDDNGKVYKHTMTVNGDQYRLVLKNMTTGAYRYTASTTVGGSSLQDKGYFTVIGQQKELTNLTADFNLLKQLSKATNGSFSLFENMPALSQDILANESLKSIIVEENKLEDLIKFKWLFWLLFSLLGLEWFVRKWAGGY